MTRFGRRVKIDFPDFQRPLRAAELFVPTHLHLDEKDEALCWWVDKEAFRNTRPGSALLQQFVNLRDAPAETILSYARRWGVLEICEHGLPACHRGAKLSCAPFSIGGNYFWEYVSDWRRHADFLGALLRLSSRLKAGERGAAQDWKTVVTHRNLQGNQWFERSGLAADRQKLSVCLNVLIAESGVRPVLVWVQDQCCIEFTGGHVIACGLYGALVCQLMLTVMGTDGMELCSACGQAYVPARRPNPARRNYCPSCGKNGVPARDAARDYRERQRLDRTM